MPTAAPALPEVTVTLAVFGHARYAHAALTYRTPHACEIEVISLLMAFSRVAASLRSREQLRHLFQHTHAAAIDD